MLDEAVAKLEKATKPEDIAGAIKKVGKYGGRQAGTAAEFTGTDELDALTQTFKELQKRAESGAVTAEIQAQASTTIQEAYKALDTLARDVTIATRAIAPCSTRGVGSRRAGRGVSTVRPSLAPGSTPDGDLGAPMEKIAGGCRKSNRSTPVRSGQTPSPPSFVERFGGRTNCSRTSCDRGTPVSATGVPLVGSAVHTAPRRHRSPNASVTADHLALYLPVQHGAGTAAAGGMHGRSDR